MKLAYAVLVISYFILTAICVLHAMLFKRHSRAALGWIVTVVMMPYVGVFLYLLFGLNRVHGRSKKLKEEIRAQSALLEDFAWADAVDPQMTSLDAAREHFSDTEIRMLRVGIKISDNRLIPNNRVRPLHNGEQAYPPMLEAIRQATSRVWVTTYIFETNDAGMEFVDALIDAHKRGVDVRVIVDGLGELYYRPIVGPKLREAGVPFARYLPPRVFPPQFYLNLRNHRKMLVVDGLIAFSGGMNIGGRHMRYDPQNKTPTQDIHFCLEGPIVRDFESLFLYDWLFARHHDRGLRGWSASRRAAQLQEQDLPPEAIRESLKGPRDLRWRPLPLRARVIGRALFEPHAIMMDELAGKGYSATPAPAPDIEAVSAPLSGETRTQLSSVDREGATSASSEESSSLVIASTPPLRELDEELSYRSAHAQAFRQRMAEVHERSLYTPDMTPELRALDEANNDFDAWCRLIDDGPDHELSRLETLISSVISAASHRVLMVSPYFLPTESIESALVNAVLRGVAVTVLIPRETNQPLVHAAMYRSIGWMIKRGVTVLMQPPPFAHTKLLIIDDRYVQLGSANIDPRSLRLNFELGVEVVDDSLVNQLMAYYEPILDKAEPLTLAKLQKRSPFRRVGDGVAWLFSPYL